MGGMPSSPRLTLLLGLFHRWTADRSCTRRVAKARRQHLPLKQPTGINGLLTQCVLRIPWHNQASHIGLTRPKPLPCAGALLLLRFEGLEVVQQALFRGT